MRTILLITVTILLISCQDNNNKNQNKISSDDISTKAKKEIENTSDLKQSGDYSNLFGREAKNCELISADELARAIEMPLSSSRFNENVSNYCSYILEENGYTTRFYFTIEPRTKEQIKNEISGHKQSMENLGNDSRLTHIQKSETGDTYLAMNQDRYIQILNEKYTSAIVLGYAPKIDITEKDVEAIYAKTDRARNQAYAIANFLLNKYKK